MHPDGQLFHLKAPTKSVKALVPQSKDYYTIVVHDPSKWAELERDYKILAGDIALSAKRGRLPVLMLDANQQIKGFTVFTPTSGTLWDLYIENPDDLATFLNLPQVYKQPRQPNEDEDWVQFWISNAGSKQVTDLVSDSARRDHL